MLTECNFFFDTDKNKTEKTAKKTHAHVNFIYLLSKNTYVKNSLTLSHNAGQITVTLK